jgi:hypothetical protein
VFASTDIACGSIYGPGAYCGVVAFAVSPSVLIEARCPRAGAHRLDGELMQGLAQEFGTNHRKWTRLDLPLCSVTGASPKNVKASSER